MIPARGLFDEDRFHGNTDWSPEQLCQQALIWGWQNQKHVVDAFDQAGIVCGSLGIDKAARSYTSFMNALHRHRATFTQRLRDRFQACAQESAGPFWRDHQWVLIGFDGSRVTAPRTIANEQAFCAPSYGHGRTAKYRRKKTQGMRRRRNERNKPQPQAPQVWITMMWHMSLRLPWTWRLGPSNSSERRHVMEMLEEETFPKQTLFCGDAGFVGYPLWNAILQAGGHFLVRVGANVNLLSEKIDYQMQEDGLVLCWPKDQMKSGVQPLRLRLVQVCVGRTQMWMLTSVLDRGALTRRMIARYYAMRWGLEVEFRGLKQTIDKANLCCRNSDRVMVELDWSIRAMAMAELLALREQIGRDEPDAAHRDKAQGEKARAAREASTYNPKDRSLAQTMRALRSCMSQLGRRPAPGQDLRTQLSKSVVYKYRCRADKKSRYRRKNPDKKPLGDPHVRIMNQKQRERLKSLFPQYAG